MNKTEGAVDKCPSCGEEVYCNMKRGSGGYADKLQWQNKDGSAHYNYDFSKPEKERVSCNKSDGEAPAPAEPAKPEAAKPDVGTEGLTRIQKKFYDVDELSELLYNSSKVQLQKIMSEFNIPTLDKEQFKEALIFIESWSRTLAQTLR
ncbi:hypothetical protein KAR91_03480 [Candidatus Pacearchaeota archaeon]|nr:hypothetical protein [Candidatus Pacearchaeota archaeon]